MIAHSRQNKDRRGEPDLRSGSPLRSLFCRKESDLRFFLPSGKKGGLFFFSGFWRKSQAIFSRDRAFPPISILFPCVFLSDRRWLCRKWHAIFGGAISARLSSPKERKGEKRSVKKSQKGARNRRKTRVFKIFLPISFLLSSPGPFSFRKRTGFSRLACFSHVFFSESFHGSGKKTRVSSTSIFFFSERPNSSNLDVRLRHRWLGKKILPFLPISGPFLRFFYRSLIG